MSARIRISPPNHPPMTDVRMVTCMRCKKQIPVDQAFLAEVSIHHGDSDERATEQPAWSQEIACCQPCGTWIAANEKMPQPGDSFEVEIP